MTQHCSFFRNVPPLFYFSQGVCFDGYNQPLTLNSQDLISNSPYCLPYSSCDVSLENLVLDQLIIP